MDMTAKGLPAGMGVRVADSATPFHDEFVALFKKEFDWLYRFLDRLSGDPDLASDLAQDSFAKLYRRGSLPDRPNAWLVTVALNLFRNTRSTASRRLRLLTVERAEHVHADPPPSPEGAAVADDRRRGVRLALDRLPERDRQLLLLRAEGMSYRDLADVLQLNEASVGTLLARAKRAFREHYDEAFDPS